MADDFRTLITPWHIGPAHEIARTRIFTLNSRRCTSVTNPARGGDFVFLQAPEWVNVIPITPDRQVVLVEQFRFGTAEVSLEIPGGVCESAEEPAGTCQRELLEETGYTSDPVRIIGRIAANPAMQTNHVHIGLARNARPQASSLALDEHEEIVVRLVPLEEIPGLIRRGIIDHSFIVAAFHFLSLTDL
jgi:ADP-ribose pyrophosphatase